MISDGLYVSLIGLAIVFLVLIVLLIAITLLNLIENKKSIINKNSGELSEKPSNKNFSKLELTAALVGVSLALGANKNENNFLSESVKKFEDSNWKALGQQRLFKGRGG